MPKSTFYTLVWSPSYQAYELYGNQRDNILELVSDGTSWSLWAHQLFSFAFHGKNGFYTARKEHKHWGEGYWYAYARVEGKLTKRYLGRSVDLTLTRLEHRKRKKHHLNLSLFPPFLLKRAASFQTIQAKRLPSRLMTQNTLA